MKKKLYLLVVCILVIVVAFSLGVINRIRHMDDKNNILLREKAMITMEEALELTTHLGIDKDVIIEVLGYDESYEKEKYFVFQEFKSLIESVSVSLDIKKSEILKNIPFDFEEQKDNSAVLVQEFIDFFEVVTELTKDKNPSLLVKTFFVLGSSTLGDGAVMITEHGKYTYSNTYDFTLRDKDLEDKKEQTHEFLIDKYLDKKVIGFFHDNELLYVKEVLPEAMILHNVWIKSSEEGSIETFLHDITRKFTTKFKLSQEIKSKIGDLVIEDGKIVKISIKPDAINGKVITANNDLIEIEKYGPLELDSDFKIYKIYGELGMEVTNRILVGYSNTDFIVANGKIVAALIKEPIKAENIRVLIKTNNFSDLFHNEVRITADRDFTITVGEEETNYKKGEEVSFKVGDDAFNKGRIFIKTKSDNGKISLLSIKRQGGAPNYRGTIEVASTPNGLVIINDVSIEEYLYAVIPSEMPNSYGLEALKVQAICARSYAYNQLFDNRYSEYGAHVDDSVAYQVYNNISETEESILAVKETYGKVIEYKDKVITAYYFSTSSGHTASVQEVWGGGEAIEYLVGKVQTKYDYVDGEAVYVSNFSDPMDLSTEDSFKDFYNTAKDTTYDSEYPWYRWSVSTSLNNITESVNENLSKRYLAAPNNILTLVSGSLKENPVFESVAIDTIGDVTNIIIHKREKSGIISELILVGSKKTIKVIAEYNIRAVLAPKSVDVIRKDESKISNLSLLPSAYFYLEKNGKDIKIYGGGYGHGVGMSQNGVKAMTDSGKSYEEIIKHYYTGVELGFIYE